MNIVIAGGSGFIGEALARKLSTENHRVTILTRNPQKKSSFHALQWDGKTLGEWSTALDGCDAVINLTGELLAGRRWSKAQKDRIISSRVHSTKVIVEAIKNAEHKPHTLINASGVGYYGDVPSGDVFEDHAPGNDFLAQVCAQWEDEARAAEQSGVRTVMTRLGVVLENGGVALPRLAMPFRLFVGGWIGTGKQWFPWIHRDDVIGAMIFAIEHTSLSGPVNLTAPQMTTNKEFCRVLGNVLHRPCWAPVPSFVLKIALGEMAEMLLAGQRAVPRKLQQHGYTFRFPSAFEALQSIYR